MPPPVPSQLHVAADVVGDTTTIANAAGLFADGQSLLNAAISPGAICAAMVLVLIVIILRRYDRIVHMLVHLVWDLITSRAGALAYCLMGRFWSQAHKAPSLTRVGMPRVDEVLVVRTAKHTGERLRVRPPLRLKPGVAPRGEPAVTLQPSIHYQTFLGFGGAFTESTASVFGKMSESNQTQIINACFSKDDGLGYRLGRLHMNSCDFSTAGWACAETPGDEKLEEFSIDRYRTAILPMMRRAALAAGCQLKLIFSPWSPPAWMKDNGSMTSGKLLPQCARTWADCYVRFAEEFAAADMPLWGLTVQNEPDNLSGRWESCSYSAEEERDFVRDHLGPALEAKGLDLKLMIWDHNRDDMFMRARATFEDPVASKYVWGIAYHWYGDPRHEFWPDPGGQALFENLQKVHEAWPTKHIVMSECCQEMGPRINSWTLGERYAESIIRDLNHWLEAWVDWNLVLDAWGGPNHANNNCSAPIIADVHRDRILYLSSFYYIGHFSRYIQPGAKRIAAASNRDHLEVTGFINPDGSLAVVVLNQSGRSTDFWLQCNGSALETESPAHSITTFLVGPSLSSTFPIVN